MRARGSITAPVVLIVVGVILLMQAISPNFRLGDLVSHYWPYALILWGTLALVEVCIRFFGSAPMPSNGISGGGWAVVVLVSLIGLAAFEVRRPDTWWRQVGFVQGMEAFGEEHEYPLEPMQRKVGGAPHVVLEDFRGDAKITGTDSTQVELSGHKTIRAFETSAADKANSQTGVELLLEGNTLIIRCHQDRADSHSPVTTSLDITVPKGASIEASGSHGDFDVSAIAGDVSISSGNAGVRLQDVGGNVKLDTRRSDLIRCTGVKGTVDLRGHGSDVELLKITGPVTVEGDYSGTVSLRDLAQSVRVKNMRTQLDVQSVPGEIRLDRGSLNGQNVTGPVKLTTHSTDVTLDGFSEGLELNVDRGDIELRPTRSAMGRIAVHARSGNIELAIPPAAKFALNASTDHGEIDNQFGESLKETAQGRGAKLEGGVGSGPDVSLVTQHGSITVRKATGETAPATKADSDEPDPEEKNQRQINGHAALAN